MCLRDTAVAKNSFRDISQNISSRSFREDLIEIIKYLIDDHKDLVDDHKYLIDT